MKSEPAILIDKVKFDGLKVRLEYQQRRPDDRYDELAIASFDRPAPELPAALRDLAQDLCDIGELHPSYAEGLAIRSVSFTYAENGVMGAVITGLKSVKTAKSPLVLNTPFLTAGPMNNSDSGPFFGDPCLKRLATLSEEAIRYINGEREQPVLPLAGAARPDDKPRS